MFSKRLSHVYAIGVGIECTYRWNIEYLPLKIRQGLNIIIIFVPNFGKSTGRG